MTKAKPLAARPSAAVIEEDFGVEDAFRSIRYNRNTKLENQKLALSLLDATERTLKEQHLPYENKNYFTALWPLLDDDERETAGKMNRAKAEEFNTTVVYLISFFIAKLPKEFIKEQYSLIFSRLPGAVQRFMPVGPFVRAAIVIIQSVLAAFEKEEWEDKPSLHTVLAVILKLAVDSRPKVRRLAQEALTALVREGVFGPEHPAKNALVRFMTRIFAKTTRKESNEALHVVPLLRLLAPRFTASEVEGMIAPILHCTSLGNTYLTVSLYGMLAFLSELMQSNADLISVENRLLIVSGLLEQRPQATVADLVPSWLNVFSKALLALNAVQPLDSIESAQRNFKLIFSYLVSEKGAVHEAVEDALRILYCTVKQEAVALLICEMMNSWLQVKNADPVPFVIRSAADYCDETGTDILPSMKPLVVMLAKMHDSKQAKHAALIEKTLGKFISRCGPEAILKIIPLSLEGQKDETPRAWLLSVLKDSVSHTRLGYFFEQLVPLSERLSEKCTEYTKRGKTQDAKVYQVVIHQIWSTLPAFMTFPQDFALVFPQMASLVGGIINNDSHLRTVLINALAFFIQRSRAFENDVENCFGVSAEQVSSDLQVLASFSQQYLPILFNVYGATPAENRGYLLTCIEAFLGITSPSTVQQYFDRVLARIVSLTGTAGSGEKSTVVLELISLLELSLALVRVLELPSYEELLKKCLPLVTFKDLTVQKRAYRLLSDMFSREDYAHLLISKHLEEIESRLMSAYESKINSAVKKGRFHLFLKLASLLPDDALHWIPAFLPEVVLGTKEVNQKTRLLAFELLLGWARRISRGGIIRADRSGGVLAVDTEASLNEYMTMLIAGLAGETPYMISASIMALARVIFELRDSLDVELLRVLIGDVVSMLQSKSREVVKSALGFVKVCISSLEPEIFAEHLQELVLGLLNWSEEHHQQFKVRVRHMMERLVRRFGFDLMWKITPPAKRRILSNIRKRKERLKRSSAAGGEKPSQTSSADLDDEDIKSFAATAISKSTMMTRNTSAIATKPSARFESALNDSASELSSEADSDSNEDDEDADFRIPTGSVLHDIDFDGDDDQIESALARKLAVATTFTRGGREAQGDERAGKRKRTQPSESEEEHVRMGEDGKLVISDGEEDSAAGDSADEDGGTKPGKQVRFAKAAKATGMQKTKPKSLGANRKRQTGAGSGGGASRKNKKLETYSYIPMRRAAKKPTPAKGATGKNVPKYFMKRS